MRSLSIAAPPYAAYIPTPIPIKIPQMVTNAFEAKRSSPLLASGVVLHVLPQGARFDLRTRSLLPFETRVDPREAEDMADRAFLRLGHRSENQAILFL